MVVKRTLWLRISIRLAFSSTSAMCSINPTSIGASKVCRQTTAPARVLPMTCQYPCCVCAQVSCKTLCGGAGRTSKKESSVEVMTLCHSETFKRTEHTASRPVDGRGVFGSAPKSPCKFTESECDLTERNFQVHDCRHPRRSS